MSILNSRTGTRSNGMPALPGYRYGGSLRDEPAPPAPPEAFLRMPERVLAALKALGGSGTAEEIGRQFEEWDAPAPPSSIRTTLSALGRRDPAPVLATELPEGGNGRPLRWHLAGQVPGEAAARGGRRPRPDPAQWLGWPEAKRAGGNTARLRRKRGMRQRDLAKAAGTGQSAVSLFENGAQRLTRAQVEAIAVVLGSTFESLTGEACAACGQVPGSRECRAACEGGKP